jgi:basic amino acid/polyamine antiporter, APA family
MHTPPSAEPGKLPRVIGPWMGTAIVIGTVIGSGVFKKPHAVARDLTEFGLIMLAWILVGVLAFIGALILAEVAVIHPRAGGNYVFLREAYGRWAGFLWGWVEFWIIRSGSIAALAGVFAESFHDLLRYAQGVSSSTDILSFWTRQAVTVTVIAVLAAVNARGTVLGGGLQLIVTSVKVVSLLGIALLPFVCLAFVTEPNVHVEYLQPIWPADATGIDWSKFGAALVAILWAYHGWMNLAPMAEEVENPNRNLPLAFLMGTLAIIVLYLSVNIAYALVVPHRDMADVNIGGASPVATLFAQRLLGPIGLLLASAAIMISVFGSLNGNLLVGPRLLYAMGKDGLAPAALSKLHANYGTPALAEFVLAGWAVLLVVGAGLLRYFSQSINEQIDYLDVLFGDTGIILYFRVTDKALFDILTDYTMFGAVAFETLAVASIFVCRRQSPVDKVPLPYRCWGYPVLPIIYVTVMAAVLGNMFYTQRTESLIAVGFIGVGAMVYVLVFANRPHQS